LPKTKQKNSSKNVFFSDANIWMWKQM
jgi:hypothetical protein